MTRKAPFKTCVCGARTLMAYRAHGFIYCHNCFETEVEAATRADGLLQRPLSDDTPVFFPSVKDEQMRVDLFDWQTVDIFVRADLEDIAYAYRKCGFIHPDIRKQMADAMGFPYQEAPTPPTTQELRMWDTCIRAYRKAMATF